MKGLRIFLGVGFLLPGVVPAEPIQRFFSLDSGYVPAISNPRAFWEFGSSIEDLASAGFDLVSNESFVGSNPLTRGLWGFAAWYEWRYQQRALFLANHEFGHGARAHAAGANPTYHFENRSGSYSNIFSYWGWAIFTSGGGYTASSGGGVAPADWWIEVGTAGVNNSSLFAESLEEELLNRRGHALSLFLYRRLKLDTFDYVRGTEAGATINGSAGDMATLVTEYQAQGYNISLKDLKYGNLAAFLMSSTSYSYLVSAGKYLFTGDASVGVPRLGNLRLPNMSHFLGRSGISLKLRSGYFSGPVLYPVSLEYQYKGKKIVELGVGRQSEYGLSWNALVNSQAALGARAGYGIKVGRSAKIQGIAGLYQLESLDGSRVAQRLSSEDLGYEFSLRYSIVY